MFNEQILVNHYYCFCVFHCVLHSSSSVLAYCILTEVWIPQGMFWWFLRTSGSGVNLPITSPIGLNCFVFYFLIGVAGVAMLVLCTNLRGGTGGEEQEWPRILDNPQLQTATWLQKQQQKFKQIQQGQNFKSQHCYLKLDSILKHFSLFGCYVYSKWSNYIFASIYN